MAYTIDQLSDLTHGQIDAIFDEDKKKRGVGCMCQWEDDSPCPVHISIDDIIERMPVGYIHNQRGSAR